MAFVHGRNARVWFNDTDLSAYMHTTGLEVDVDNADSTVLDNDGWRTNIAGQAGATASFDGYHDVALDDVLQAAIAVDSGVLTYCPGGGTTVGDAARLIAVTATAIGEAPSPDAVSPVSWAVASQAALAFGYVLHPLDEDTNTTTGDDIDGGASSSTGWTAHLHVTLVDGGSWVITVQDSADGSTGWATIATFAAKTAVGSERLLSAAADTAVKRYTRVVATRTGGSAGQGITYALAFARSRAS